MLVTRTTRRRYWRRRYVPTYVGAPVVDSLSIRDPYGASTVLAPSAPLYFGAAGADTTSSYRETTTSGAVVADGWRYSGAASIAEWRRWRDLRSVVVETVETVEAPTGADALATVPTDYSGAVFAIAPTTVAAPIPTRAVDSRTVVGCGAESDIPDDWTGAATVRVCTVPRRNGAECGRQYRPIFRGMDENRAASWECAKHGAESYAWRYVETGDAPTQWVDHMAWCSECDWTHTRIVRADDGARRLDCPKHGADATTGADLPRIIDNDSAPAARSERIGTDAGWMPPRPGAESEWMPLGRELGTAYRDNTSRGDAIQHGADRGRRGKQVRGESRGWVAASGRYRVRLTAPTPDGSAVVVRRQSAPVASGAAGVPTTAPHAVMSRDGTRVLETVPSAVRAALIKRDARLSAVISRQTRESAPVVSRRNAVNGAAGGAAGKGKARKTGAELQATRDARNARRRARAAAAAARISAAGDAVRDGAS